MRLEEIAVLEAALGILGNAQDAVEPGSQRAYMALQDFVGAGWCQHGQHRAVLAPCWRCTAENWYHAGELEIFYKPQGETEKRWLRWDDVHPNEAPCFNATKENYRRAAPRPSWHDNVLAWWQAGTLQVAVATARKGGEVIWRDWTARHADNRRPTFGHRLGQAGYRCRPVEEEVSCKAMYDKARAWHEKTRLVASDDGGQTFWLYKAFNDDVFEQNMNDGMIFRYLSDDEGLTPDPAHEGRMVVIKAK